MISMINKLLKESSSKHCYAGQKIDVTLMDLVIPTGPDAAIGHGNVLSDRSQMRALPAEVKEK
jgi:hypothetical protein